MKQVVADWTPELRGLELGHAQVWGAVRLVPVIRPQTLHGLRLHKQVVQQTAAVSIDEGHYVSFVPHGYVLRWEDEQDGNASEGAALGTVMTTKSRLDSADFAPLRVVHGQVHRMVKRTKQGLRFLPLHLAMEGFLTYQFGGPSRLFSEYSQDVIRRGLSPRVEWSMRGRSVPDLEDALRIFEIHPNQVGVLLFVGDEFYSAFVVPHADDYRALHRDLLSDFFADTLIYHALGYPNVPDWQVETSGEEVKSLADIRGFLARTEREWGEFHRGLADQFFGRPHRAKERYRLGSFSLRQLLPSFDPKVDNHIGECILGGDGTLAYLKSYRLSAAQSRRAYLLQQLASVDWDLGACATLFRSTPAEFIRRLEKAGFGYLLKPHVLAEAMRAMRSNTRGR
ncbi:MAG: hypothetical protein AB8H86_23935 [Polyangiales bacterium]